MFIRIWNVLYRDKMITLLNKRLNKVNHKLAKYFEDNEGVCDNNED